MLPQQSDLSLPDGTVSATEMQERFARAGAVPCAGSRGKNCPAEFQKGVAISMWQNSGSDTKNTNWDQFSTQRGKFFGLVPNIMDRTVNMPASDFWNRYEDDIQLAKNLGITAFRFSIEWHHIEPQQGVINQAAIAHYHKIISAITAAGMVPNATLHHFVHPLWWHNLGAFEKTENLQHFIDYCALAAREFGPRIKLWSTFNEPTCYLVCGYIIGVHPPGKMARFWQAGEVIRNMLHSHTRAYRAMKAEPGCSDLEIGIVHHHVEFMPRSPKYWWIKPLAWWGTFWWGRDIVPNYFKTGVIEWQVPLLGKTFKFQEEGGRPPLDWWGINYYARGVISWYCLPAIMPGETMTDMGYTVYPASMYENIVRGSQLGVPMYITETGAADDSLEEAGRKACLQSYLGQCLKAVRDGYDVRGFYYWTLVDNFEWNTGHKMRFGLYEWNMDGTNDRKLREGGRLLGSIYASLPNDMVSLRRHLMETYHECEYSLRVLHEQALDAPRSVIWNKGKHCDAPPLSTLHMRIGFDDLSSSGAPGEQPDFHSADPHASSSQAKKVQYA